MQEREDGIEELREIVKSLKGALKSFNIACLEEFYSKKYDNVIFNAGTEIMIESSEFLIKLNDFYAKLNLINDTYISID